MIYYQQFSLLCNNIISKQMLVDTAFEYPADLTKAWKHRLASRIFKGITQQSTSYERCECCGKRIGQINVQTSCWYSPIVQLVFLGPGVPLLFVFIQNGAAILIIFSLIFTVYATITNILGNSCNSDVNCINDIFNKLSMSNKINDDQSVMVQTYLISGSIFFYLFLAQLMIFRIRKVNGICDQIINSPSDYSIIIKNLPQNVRNQDIEAMINQLKNKLNRHQRQITKDLSIKKIIISYAVQQYLHRKKQQQKEFLKIKKQHADSLYHRAPIELPTKTASIAIVVFDKQVSKQMFFEQYINQKDCRQLLTTCCQDISNFYVKNQPVIIKRALQPDDIIWQNTKIPKFRLYRNVFISYFFGILILLSGGIIQYYLQYYQQKMKGSSSFTYLGYATSIIVSIFNAIIVQFLIIVTKLQGHRTKTDLDQSLLVKICLYSFFNSGIFYSLASILAQSINNFDIQGDFSFEVTFFMALNAVQTPMTNLIMNKLEIPTFAFRYLLKTGCLKYSQKQANQIYQLVAVDFPVKYAFVIKTIWLTCFYASFAPIVVPISVFGLILFYFTEAQLFRTKYKYPDMLSIHITRAAMRLLDFTGLFLSVGQILITFYIKFLFKTHYSVPEQAGICLCLGLSILLIVFPSKNLNKRLFKFDEKFQNEIQYEAALKDFQTTYEITNPLTVFADRKRKSEVNLLKYLKVNDQVEMTNLRGSRLPTIPLFDLLIRDKNQQK